MNIKTRILLFVVLFELFAYSSIQLFNNYIYKHELLDLKEKELLQTFTASTLKIDLLSRLMERNVTDLAQSGEGLYTLVKAGQVDMSHLEAESKRLLVENFLGFPEAIGGGLWYEPFVLSPSLKYFGPYAYRGGTKVQFSWELNTPEYDYHNQDWYTLASKSWHNLSPIPRQVVWTSPYYDEAGSYSLMMTVDAVMYDNKGQPIGMSTVDWALGELTDFLESVKISDNAFPFLIHKESSKFLSYPKHDKLVMQSATLFEWGAQVLDSQEVGTLQQLDGIRIDNMLYSIYFYHTQSGFIFGSLSPVFDQENEIATITTVTLIAGFGIGAVFILLMILVMKWLFSPFDKVLHLIRSSISHQEDEGQDVQVSQIDYNRENEFTPIIKELNQVYGQINRYMSEITRSNKSLKASKIQIDQLNAGLEQKVEQRTAQLAAKTQEAIDSLAQLKRTQTQLIEQEKHASLGRLVSGVAHEINTPLGVSITSASLINAKIRSLHDKFKSNDLKKNEFLEFILGLMETTQLLENNLDRASKLVCSFKQVSADQADDKPRAFLLGNYLEQVLLSLHPNISQTPHKIHLEKLEDDIQLTASPGVIVQIITNLIDNALSHAFAEGQKGEILISYGTFIDDQTLSKQVKICVQDNGKGMSEEVQEHIFEPFFTTSRHLGATGLGMHLVFNLVQRQLSGQIHCQSKPGEGTKISISFPVFH